MWGYSTPGNTSVGARTNLGTGWKTAKQVISVDWNNDNVMDVLARWSSGALTLHAGNASGTFSPGVTLGNGWQNFDITATQLKMHENYPGLVARDLIGGKLYYYPNTNGRSFAYRITMGNGWGPMTELNALDWDKDGAMDIIARNSRGELWLYRTNGNAAFVSESRKRVGTGWNSFNSISAEPNFAGTGTTGLLARTSTGSLRYYPVISGGIRTAKTIGNGWNGYTISAGSVPPAKLATSGAEYSQRVYNYVKNWCPNARIILDHPSVTSGNVYGMMWWTGANFAIRTGIPEGITKPIALHECGHLLQAKAFGINGKNTAIARMKAIYGGTGTYGLEANADCIAAYLNPYSQPAAVSMNSQAHHWATRCTGYKGEAAKKIIRGIRP